MIRPLYLAAIFLLALTAVLSRCKPNEKERAAVALPPGDKDNGGLFLPGGFQAVVVTDSIGRARHIAVNDNGDLYVKLAYNDLMHGRGGTVALRDADNDGKADVVAYFGDGKTYNGIMPAYGSFLDDHAIASILTYLQIRFNKVKNPFTSAEVTRLRKK